MNIRAKLDALGLTLPPAAKPVAEYVPAVMHAGEILVSGQLPMREGTLLATGAMPGACSLVEAQAAAAQCVLNGLAAVDDLLAGDWTQFERVLMLTVFVASEPGYTEHHKVANGASELLGKLFGETGRHARAAVGVASLPLGATVEVAIRLAVSISP